MIQRLETVMIGFCALVTWAAACPPTGGLLAVPYELAKAKSAPIEIVRLERPAPIERPPAPPPSEERTTRAPKLQVTPAPLQAQGSDVEHWVCLGYEETVNGVMQCVRDTMPLLEAGVRERGQ